MAKDHYDTLGITKSASKDEVKKAFHKLAHKYHPDKKGGDEKRFKEVNEAYQVLSDDGRRAEYDRYGQTFGSSSNASGGGFGFDTGGWDINDIFRQATGGTGGADIGDIFGDFFGGGGRARERRGSDVSIDITLTFRDSIFGAKRNVSLHKLSRCLGCNGNGAKNAGETINCSHCNGKGTLRENRRSLFGTVSVERSCEQCLGDGRIPKDKCTICHGEGVQKRQEDIAIDIPAGIEDGEVVRMTGKGQAIRGGTPGDLYVRLHVETHPTFRRERENITTTLSVKLSDALLGNRYAFETLDGKIDISIPAGVGTGEVLRVKGKGAPIDRTRRGDLLVRIVVAMPRELSKTARANIEALRNEGI